MSAPGLQSRIILPGRPNFFDLLAILYMLGLAVLVAQVARHTLAPLSAPDSATIHLDPSWLPGYALRTTLRMFAALGASLVFTFTYAVIAAKSRRAGMLLVPVLDVLQSVPILGFLTFTAVFFMGLFPGRVLGAELAAIFTIFTSQAWNMAFSMYLSLRSVPAELDEAARNFGLTSWQRFWRLEVPVAVPSLVWNTMVSMSGGWFMVVYSETITVGDTNVVLPGIGSYVGAAIAQRNIAAVLYAIIAMSIVILAYDQILFRPLVAWSARFRLENTQGAQASEPWVLILFRRSSLLRAVTAWAMAQLRHVGALRIGRKPGMNRPPRSQARLSGAIWPIAAIGSAAIAGWELWRYAHYYYSLPELGHVFVLGLITLARVVTMVVLASLIWVPVGIWLGLRPAWARRTQLVAQFMAAFPANLFFPIFVLAIVHHDLNADIWLTPLMILGTQWYILFAVVGAAASVPTELLEAARSFHVRGWLWWIKVMLPAVMPIYLAGALAASGGAWNAAIAAEVATWGDITLHAHGLGAYIAQGSLEGSTPHVALGMTVMALFVVLFNRLVWRPLQNWATRRFTLS